jgi:hypothetical protein
LLTGARGNRLSKYAWLPAADFPVSSPLRSRSVNTYQKEQAQFGIAVLNINGIPD